MKSAHKMTMSRIFHNPVQSGIPWRDVESMLKALSAEITEGNGSRVRVSLNGVRAVFHRPHPRKETDKGAIVFLRQFLIEAKVKDVKI
ncbi:MAG: hypothetical protein B7Y25_08275 [Alphaproteobacteria bacterium 16-39-46]|nr:MAG: hypothetical protein B7Y25_08275 [Alphaproteobacteria bacterium 16-39-46]OZA41210.1 MAG: hypothetical protein B7X84_08385 [Alphaproteobacteria bacterium 17-39-52]HQS84663.1 type II toxin-antitoxin system HicA family toxin [Alphaproteobacteria bacterium]HQS93122.1 type II toxin-antitoxin system HicA family toxin [Alphaproteobacteria bacterium]